MILTGRKLEEIGRAVFFEDWIAIVARRMRCARKTLTRYKNEERPIPAEFSNGFAMLVEDQLAAVAACHDQLQAGTDEF